MNKTEMLDALQAEFRAMLVQVQDFAAADFERAGLVGDWSAKDLFGHIAYWNSEAARAIDQVRQNLRPVMMLDQDDDAINARETAERHALPLPKVMDEYRRAHRALEDALRFIPEQDMHRATGHQSGDGKHANAAWIAQGIIEHYQEHRAALASALQK